MIAYKKIKKQIIFYHLFMMNLKM